MIFRKCRKKNFHSDKNEGVKRWILKKRSGNSKQDQEKEKEWSLILRLPKEVIDFCDKFDTAQGNMYDTPIDFRKFSSGYLDGKCFGEQKRLQPARHTGTI